MGSSFAVLKQGESVDRGQHDQRRYGRSRLCVGEERTLGVTPEELDQTASLRLLPRWERRRHRQPRTTAAEKPLVRALKEIFTPRKEMSCKGRGIAGLQREEGYVHHPN